jgi:hypothetical protein
MNNDCQTCQNPPCDCCDTLGPTEVTITITGISLDECEEYQRMLREESGGDVTVTPLE